MRRLSVCGEELVWLRPGSALAIALLPGESIPFRRYPLPCHLPAAVSGLNRPPGSRSSIAKICVNYNKCLINVKLRAAEHAERRPPRGKCKTPCCTRAAICPPLFGIWGGGTQSCTVLAGPYSRKGFTTRFSSLPSGWGMMAKPRRLIRLSILWLSVSTSPTMLR